MEAQKIKRRRKELGLTQENIAKGLGISQKAYCDIENGKTKLKTDTLDQVCKLLRITPFSVCPIACECALDIESKHNKLLSFLETNNIEIPVELL
ncbi:helix-turn-helix domain-containing protein [Myroides sp. LJL116]